MKNPHPDIPQGTPAIDIQVIVIIEFAYMRYLLWIAMVRPAAGTPTVVTIRQTAS
jgi:hypothetical protein